MARLIFGFLCLLLPALWAAPRPKLLVAITIDQFRYDYLSRFRPHYTGGLARLLDGGAVFTNAHYEHFPTVTAVGHATFLSGAAPALSGIIANSWYDREAGRQVTSVSDDATRLLGVAEPRSGASPRRLLVSTLADELKMVHGSKTRAIGVSIKDRSAILPVGRMADAAYWFDAATGNFVSSTYYFPQLPVWVEEYNRRRPADKYLGQSWIPFDHPSARPFRQLPTEPGKAFYDGVERTPYGNQLVLDFAQAVVEHEQLGQRGGTDVLAVSLSSNDRVGHEVGPDAPEVRDLSIQTDRQLGQFLSYLDGKLGRQSYLVVLTADHGVAPLPEVMQQRRMPGGRLPERAVVQAIEDALTAKYGGGVWLASKSAEMPYLNYETVRQKGLALEEVLQVAAEAVRRVPHIARVYTRSQLEKGRFGGDGIDLRVRNGFHVVRGPDLCVIVEPYWLTDGSGTSHGTPYSYDSHVPVIFFGPGVRPGRYHARVAVNDIAPTLATYFEVETPSGATGRVLAEIFTD
jgi:arylsulfatase A-like enzyme